MLPIQVFQIDYQDISNIVSMHIDSIFDYQRDNNIVFDCVLAKLRNGTIPGSMIANYLQIPMGVIEATRENKECSMFLPIEIVNKIHNNEIVNILFTDGICGTGKTLALIKEYISTHSFSKNINLVTYCTFIDNKANTKPDISGLVVVDKFIQPPWEWRSYTPQVHLDRLSTNDIKGSEEKEFCFGFFDKDTKNSFLSLQDDIVLEWDMIFLNNESKTNTASGVSSYLEIPEKITITECLTKYKNLIQEKVDFINSNGLTHYIDKDINQAIVLANKCPICHILYIENNKIFRLFSNEFKLNDLNFNN